MVVKKKNVPKNTAKNIHSRAYHAARSQARRDGKSDMEAKETMCEQYKQHKCHFTSMC